MHIHVYILYLGPRSALQSHGNVSRNIPLLQQSAFLIEYKELKVDLKLACTELDYKGHSAIRYSQLQTGMFQELKKNNGVILNLFRTSDVGQ